MAAIAALLLSLCVQQAAAVQTTVDLTYATYQGKSLEDGCNGWFGMRYAQAKRFGRPYDPIKTTTVQNATAFQPLCLGTGDNAASSKNSEDCLFINVWAPSNATEDSKLPVFVSIPGGGFNINTGPILNGRKLIKASDDNMVIVQFNYRVGPYGFLASTEMAEDQSVALNAGLLDQRAALQWVQKHISKFGGDPKHVTIGGGSAGGGSVVLQLTAYGGRDDKLFHAAAAESAAFPPLRTPEENQFAYDALLQKTKCKNAENTLNCLKTLDVEEFSKASQSLIANKLKFPGSPDSPLWLFNPILDGDFVRDYTYDEIAAGHFVKVPTIFGDTTNEGFGFTPKDTASKAQARDFVSSQFAPFSEEQMDELAKAYPETPTTDGQSANWRVVAGLQYADMRYICGGLNISNAYAKKSTAPTYNYHWNVGEAGHVADSAAVWGGGDSASAVFIHSFWANFIRYFNPNERPIAFQVGERVIDSPVWEVFGRGGGRRLLFDNNDVVKMEDVSQEQRAKCDAISKLGVQTKQ